MVRQYRHPIEQITLEIPAGKLDKLPQETRCTPPIGELREETGFVAEQMISLGQVYPSPGLLDEVLYLFLARGLQKLAQELDEDEIHPCGMDGMWHSWKISLQVERSMMSRRFVRYSVRRCASCCELGGGKMNRQSQERAQILYAFGLSLVFVLIDWMVFTLLVSPVPVGAYRPAWLCNAVHLTLLS